MTKTIKKKSTYHRRFYSRRRRKGAGILVCRDAIYYALQKSFKQTGTRHAPDAQPVRHRSPDTLLTPPPPDTRHRPAAPCFFPPGRHHKERRIRTRGGGRLRPPHLPLRNALKHENIRNNTQAILSSDTGQHSHAVTHYPTAMTRYPINPNDVPPTNHRYPRHPIRPPTLKTFGALF